MLDRLFLLLVATAVGIPAMATGKASSCPCVQITPQRLPDLNIPREGHAVFCAGGELMVAGGHTNGFVPTATAEYLMDGEWQYDGGYIMADRRAQQAYLCGVDKDKRFYVVSIGYGVGQRKGHHHR